MTADRSALIARLEAAEAGSRELNGLIFRALADDPHGRDHWFMSCGELMTEDNAPYVTTSLDAALALAERVLPEGWRGHIEIGGGAPFYAFISDDGPAPELREVRGTSKSPALALCIAILRAIHTGYEAAGEVSPNLKAKAQGEGG